MVYGAGGDAVAVAVSPKEITKILHSKTGHNTIFNLAITGGENTPVMIVDWQHDPIKDKLLHVDLKRIDLTKRIQRQGAGAHTAIPRASSCRAACTRSSPAKSKSSACRTKFRKSSPWT